MKAKSENYTTRYEPEKIEDTDITITFSDSFQDGERSVSASVKIGEQEHGHLGYSTRNDYIVSQLKPLNEEILKNVDKIFSKFGECLVEILSK